MAVQDDKRERQMRDRFNLKVDEGRKRDGIDAYLKIDNRIVNFELKSTTSGSVSTVRDFGAEHIKKWRDLHWIIAVYDKRGEDIIQCHYASPRDMLPWIEKKRQYVLPDLILGKDIPGFVSPEMIKSIFDGKSEPFSYKDAKWLMKNQWSRDRYLAEADMGRGYSLMKMTEILEERCSYLMARGSTLNNPHIEKSFVAKLPLLDEEEPAHDLRELVRNYFATAAETDEATA
ncbi:hypothetical protein GCM10009639_46560 [Kitasatospora putterlickiae]|uniref:DUF4365 domain-containing protein n=1 Tax=Kitasatospora putterlickiae TaxID=221725 RepID=A0ABN1YCZ0_9ACTN